MATLALRTVSLTAGVDLAAVAAASGGDEFVNNGRTRFLLKNASGSSITATFATAGVDNATGLPIGDLAVVITAGDDFVAGPFDPGTYNDSNGKVQVTYSDVTTLTVSAFKDA